VKSAGTGCAAEHKLRRTRREAIFYVIVGYFDAIGDTNAPQPDFITVSLQ
jgi:hypothetical protein